MDDIKYKYYISTSSTIYRIKPCRMPRSVDCDYYSECYYPAYGWQLNWWDRSDLLYHCKEIDEIEARLWMI